MSNYVNALVINYENMAKNRIKLLRETT